MRSATYISDLGGMAQLSNQPPFYVTRHDLNSAQAEFDSYRIAGQDGLFTADGGYGQKVVIIEGTIVAAGKPALTSYRSAMASAMNIHREGWLIIEADGGERYKIRCRPNAAPYFGDPMGLGQPFRAEWLCDTPYWTAYADVITAIGRILPLWRFPFAAPVLFGRGVADATIRGHESVEIPLRVEILSQATLITLTNTTTGARLVVAREIGEGEKMVIDGNTAEIYVQTLLTGAKEDATSRLEAGSRFLTLAPGELNRITLDNGIIGATPLAYLIYGDPYLAI